MQWTDEAIILSARPHGETSMIVTLLTSENGCCSGLVNGGQSRKRTPLLQPGNIVQAKWRARLPDHLGWFQLELITSTAAPWLNDPKVLAIISSATTLVEAALPERQEMCSIFNGLHALFEIKDRDLWPPAYIKWELGLLKALGYGLNLSCCALTGVTEGLAYISPKTGRAVTEEAAEPYRNKLLRLPAFLLQVESKMEMQCYYNSMSYWNCTGSH